MRRVNCSNLNIILAFDGEVFEVFYGEHSQRVHLGHITGIEVKTDRKGKRTLHVYTLEGEIPYLPFDEQVPAGLDELVAEVQQALAAFKF